MYRPKFYNTLFNILSIYNDTEITTCMQFLLQRVAELNLSRGSPTHFAAYADMRPSSSAAPSAAIGKSTSLSTIGNDPADPVVDHNEIIALTHDVKNFSDTLAKLKFLFIEGLGEWQYVC